MPKADHIKTVLLCGHRDNEIMRQAEGLAEIGVTLKWITPDAFVAGMSDGTIEEQVREAAICIIGRGVPEHVGVALLRLRAGLGDRTWFAAGVCTAAQKGFKILGGGNPPGLSVAQADMPLLLREIFLIRRPTPQIEAATDRRLPAAPRLYRSRVGAFTRAEVSADQRERTHARAVGDLLSPDELVGAGLAVTSGLASLILKTPSDQLGVLGDPRMADIWMNADRRGELEVNLYRALVRDGGRETLSGLPTSLQAHRASAEESWDRALEKARGNIKWFFASMHRVIHPNLPNAESTIFESTLIPWDDPLGPDADPIEFMPTITTLRVARRYRPAGDVLMESRRRWGGRPFLSRASRVLHLMEFVGESAPTSAEDIEAWVRAIASLPNGLMADSVTEGILKWPVIEVPIANELLRRGWIDFGCTKRTLSTVMPLFGADREIISEVLDTIESDELREYCRAQEAVPRSTPKRQTRV